MNNAAAMATPNRFLRLLLFFSFFFCLPFWISAQRVDLGFEEWEQPSPRYRENPVGWFIDAPGTNKVEKAHSGNYAVGIWTWYIAQIGYLGIGRFSPPEPPDPFDLRHMGTPISYIPARLTGYYRYELGNLETSFSQPELKTAVVHVLVKRYNPELGDIDTISFVSHLLPPTDTWTRFDIRLPVRLNNVQPDSIAVVFYSTNPERLVWCAGSCCFLYLDDLSFETSSGVSDDDTRVYLIPNPVLHENLSFQFGGKEGIRYDVAIYDLSGKVVHRQESEGGRGAFSGLDLAAGVYYVSVSDPDGRQIAWDRFVAE